MAQGFQMGEMAVGSGGFGNVFPDEVDDSPVRYYFTLHGATVPYAIIQSQDTIEVSASNQSLLG